MSPLFPKLENQELLQFTAEVNLLDWMHEVKWSESIIEALPGLAGLGGKSRMDFDAEGLAKKFMGDEYEYHRKRLFKKLHGRKKIAKKFTPYFGESEFLEFTADTAHNWGGPFTHNGKLGASLEIRSLPLRPFDSFANMLVSWSHFDLPYAFREANKEVFNDHNLYHMSPEDKVNAFKSLPRDIQVQVLLSRRKWITEDAIEEYMPVRLILRGNDDTSYTKYFMTEEEAELEAQYLRKMQPLDFSHDVRIRRYFFTN